MNTKNKSGLPARFLAFQALHDSSIKALPTERIQMLAERYDTSASDRALAYDILAGSIKRRTTIDHLIRIIASRRPKNISSEILTIIRLGIYQMLFEDSVPDFAVIDTACELTKQFAGERQVGFVNAVLRNVQRAIETGSEKIDNENEMYIVPAGSDMGVKFNIPILPGQAKPVEHLSLAYSYPSWLVKRWGKVWDYNTLRLILASENSRPAIVLRPNPIKLTERSASSLCQILEKQNCKVKLLEDVDCVELIDGPRITELDAFNEGLFQVQDPAASELAKNLDLKNGMKILDLCAGLGTKTTQLAELTADRAEIFATDRISGKLKKLKQNADRLGLKSIKTPDLGELDEDRFANFFDIVILDVPCTNSGVFDRRPEARWRIKERDFQNYAQGSIKLLAKADRLVKPEGQIGFSTCSIDEQENGLLIEGFCSQTSWEISSQHFQLPILDESSQKTIRTGGYWAILHRF